MAGERWIFTNSQLLDTPSRKCGIDNDKELAYRQQAANLIQEMGQSLIVTQLCINTAIVYMHRFYMFHSFSRFHRNSMAPVCLFLAAKVEEQPRKLEHVLKLVHKLVHKDGPFDAKSDDYLQQAHELVVNENILLQTLGFDLTVDHPHTHVVKTCQLVRASKDLAQTSYFLATNSLHLTTMCLQYKPTVVACACVHLACKWSSWEIPRSSEGKEWHWYLDKNVTVKLLEDMSQEFLAILDKCPSKLRKKILTWKSGKDRPEEYDPEKKKQAAQQSRDASASKSSSHHHSVSNHDRKGDKSSHHSKSDTSSHSSSKHHSDPSGTSHTGNHHHQRSDSAASKNPAQTSTDSNKHSSDPPHSGTVAYPSTPATAAAAAVPTATTTSTTKTTLKEYWEKQREKEKREAAAAEKIKLEPRESSEERKVPSVKLEPGQHSSVEKSRHHHHRDREHHKDQHRQQRDLEKISDTKIKIKSEPGLSHHKVTNESSSPLKLKIKMPKDQSSHGDKKHSSSQSSSQSEQKVPPLKISSGSSRHRESHHHKSHKSSRHSSSNSEQSMNHTGDGHHAGTNGRSDLKLHINMNTMSSSSSKSGREGKSERHRDKNPRSSSSHQDPAKSASSSSHSHSGHPWTVSELMASTAASNSMPSSSSRKRPHSPATDHLNDIHKNKVSKSETNLRRSSSNHSIVSMDLSDTGSLTGGDVFNTETNIALRGLEGGSRNNSPLIDNSKEKLDMRIQELQQVIDLQKAQIALQQTPGNPQAPPPPPAPSLSTPFSDMPMQLFDMDFLSDDALPPLPGDITEKPPTPPHF